MFVFSSGGACCGKRRAAVSVAVIAAAIGGIVATLFDDHPHDGGPSDGWRLASIVICSVAIVIAAVLLLVRWRRGQESD